MHLAFNLSRLPMTPGDFEVIEVLQIQPKLGIGVEKSRQPQSCFRGNAAAFMDNFTDAGRWNVQFEGKLVDRELQRFHEIFAQNLSGMDWGHEPLSFLFAHDFTLLVIINDFDAMAMAIAPSETDPPLVVNADRVLPLPPATQCFQAIARRRSQDS
jgi:hypothetical protein